MVCWADPEKGTMPCRQHLFLMVAGDQEVTGPLTASVLRSPSEVNAELFEEIHQAYYFGFPNHSESEVESQMDSDSKIRNMVETLPLLTAADFRITDEACSQSLVQCINEKKNETEGEEGGEVTVGELVRCVREGQEALLSQGQRQTPLDSGGRKPVTEFISLQDLESISVEWPERRTLLQNESTAKVLRRYQSNESCSLMLSSPLAPEDSSMDAKDMVKWFKPDGNAVNEDLSPVKPAVRPHRLSNHEEVSLDWPACKDLQYHDVYYEHTKKSERQERFFQKFRDNILLEESHHVCSDKPHVPALRYRNHSRRSQMDVSCGGSKLTPISRQTLSPSSMLQATPSSKRLSRESGHKKDTRSVAMVRGEGHFSAPKSKVRKDRSLSLESSGSSKGRRSEESSLLEESLDGSRAHSSSSRRSNSTLPPFRRLSKPDVNIFTPSQKLLGQANSSGDLLESASGLPQKKRSASMSSEEGSERRLSSESLDSTASRSTDQPQESRSQRHKRRLERVVTTVLGEAGVSTKDSLYASCFSKLYQVTLFYAKQLPDAHNLKAELRNIAEKQVQQVVDLERRRQDLAVKKKLRKSSLVGQI